MNKHAQTVLALTRIAFGWLFFYAGITKVLDPTWSAAGYLQNAQTFPELYNWLASPGILPFTNFLNEWGLTIIGLALILGLWTRWAALAGAVMMVLYWFPVLDFPHVEHGYLVDDHVIYALVLLFIFFAGAPKWSLAKKLGRQ